MTKSHLQKSKMQDKHLYYSYETGRTMLYLESDDDNLILIKNEHNIFVEAVNNEQLTHSYVELGVADSDFITLQLNMLSMIQSTIEHIEKAFIMSQITQMLSDLAPNVKAKIIEDRCLPKQVKVNIYKTIKDMINNDQYYPFKIVATNEDDDVEFEVILDEDKKKSIMATDGYKELERKMQSLNPSIKDVVEIILDQMADDIEELIQ